MKVAVLCEFSGVVRDAFRRAGHYAVSCDLLPTESPGPHIQGDCLQYDWSWFDLVIAHPPCTYLCNSGVRWLRNPDGTWNAERWAQMEAAAEFFKAILALPVPRIGVENPIMHKYARESIDYPMAGSFQPWQHGHGEVKRTCLWLKGLPMLEPSNVVEGREARVHKASPGPNRWAERSRTFEGVAQAMVEQWGRLDLDSTRTGSFPAATRGLVASPTP